jgi:hypothetical protein
VYAHEVDEDINSLFGLQDTPLASSKDLALCPLCDWRTTFGLRATLGEAGFGRFGPDSKKNHFLRVVQGFFDTTTTLHINDLWRSVELSCFF